LALLASDLSESCTTVPLASRSTNEGPVAAPPGARRSSTLYSEVVSSTPFVQKAMVRVRRVRVRGFGTPSVVVDWLMLRAWLMSRATTMKVVRSS
jgi:hypothetical protein